jgi:predicted PurR-regulated permease PerM
VPNLGPWLSLIPAVFVAFTVGPWSALWVVLLYFGIQALESNLITPLIQQRAVSVPPALLIVFQLLMGVFAGIWGMVAATPLLVVVMLLVQTLYIRGVLDKDGPLISDAH